MEIYIAYRDLQKYFTEHVISGGPHFNTEYRMTSTKDGNYLLSYHGDDYAVPKEAGDKFVADVLSRSGEKHRGFFPVEPSLNGKSVAAVVEVQEDDLKPYYYDGIDAETLLPMLDDLRALCGSPLPQSEKISPFYPNPSLPADFELQSIPHPFYTGPATTPADLLHAPYCPHCGALRTSEMTRFCTECGSALES